MSKTYPFNSFSNDTPLSCPELILIQEDYNTSNTPTHAHDFWQLEIAVSGWFEMSSGETVIRATADDCVLVPPGVPHRVTYGGCDQRSWSIKFKLDTSQKLNQITLIEPTPDSINAKKNLVEALNRISMSIGSYTSLQYLIGLLVQLEIQREVVNDSSDLITQLKTRIDFRGGNPITVDELADMLKCSRKHISKTFYESTGIQLKSYIDQRRAEVASEMLLYSQQNITKIAEILQFPDVYSFSRFFKRIYGCSPRQYRAQEVRESQNI